MKYKLKLDTKITEQFPEYSTLIIYAENLTNSNLSTELLERVIQEKRAEFKDEKASSHPHIQTWREAYRRFGLKPSKYPCSVEALLERTLKGGSLPHINLVVDLYNAISLKYVLPIGGEDLDKLVSDLTLTTATGQEEFDTLENGQPVISHPQAGEVVWKDEQGVTCRGWNWRQCYRTRLTEQTVNAYFVLDCLSPYKIETLLQAGKDLINNLKVVSPNCTISQELLGKQS